jgi:hypothetical protein
MAITIHHGTDNKREEKLIHSTPPLMRSDNQPDKGDAVIGLSVQRVIEVEGRTEQCGHISNHEDQPYLQGGITIYLLQPQWHGGLHCGQCDSKKLIVNTSHTDWN